MRLISEIIVHTAETRPNWMAGKPTSAKVAEIRRWHIEERRWKDIGYHYVIDRDGTIAKGRLDSVVGAHVSGRNANSLGVCLIGGYSGKKTDAFENHYTPEQDRALRGLITRLRTQYPQITTVSGHNQHAARECPCFSVPQWLNRQTGLLPPKIVQPVETFWQQILRFFGVI